MYWKHSEVPVICQGCGRCMVCGHRWFAAHKHFEYPLPSHGIGNDPHAHITTHADSWDLNTGDPLDKEMEMDHSWNQWVKNVEPGE